MEDDMRTPWGESDRVEVITPGLYFITTPSHGGYKVDSPLLDRIPLEWRQASFNGNGLRGWFEEDCDWSMVALTFLELFSDSTKNTAKLTFDHWIRPKL